MLPTIGGTSGATGLNATYLNQLIQASLQQQRRPLELLREERDRVDIRRAVYRDLESILSSLKTQAGVWTADSQSIVDKKRVASSDTGILTATVQSSAAAGAYTIQISQLAQAHQVRSAQAIYENQPLGLEGTFVLGHRAERAADWTPDAGGMIAGGGAAAISAGQKELKSGDYYVETRQYDGQWQFRLVDADGRAVSIASISGNGTFTTEWQTLADGAHSYDSGRGLTIEFAEARAAVLRPEAAKASYIAQGAQIEVEASHTLEQIRDMINNAVYAEGEAVRASVVDRQLVLRSAETGAGHALRISTEDAPTGNVIAGLDLWNDGSWLHETQDAQNAAFVVNGVNVTRSRNTGLEDVIAGVSLNLLGRTDGDATVTLTVSEDNAAVSSQINSFISAFNNTTSYLLSKTATTQRSDGIYSRETLAGDMVFHSLRMNLITDLLNPLGGLNEGAPRTLREIGIDFDVDTMRLSISDSTALNNALDSHRAGVAELLQGVMERIESRLDTFTGASGVLSRSAEQIERQIQYLDNRKTVLQERLTAQEELLTRRYSILLQQFAQLQAQASSIGLFNSFNQYG